MDYLLLTSNACAMDREVVVDWAAVHAQVRTGQHVCPEHGLVDRPYRGIVSGCPDCMRQTFIATRTPDGDVTWRTETPSRCAGPDRHRLTPGKILLSHRPCVCTPAGGHRTWTCQAPGCGDVQQWPPHHLVELD